MSNVHRALWVQEVMCRPISNIFLKSSSHRLVHPVEDKGDEDEEENDEGTGKTCTLGYTYIPDYGFVGVNQVSVS